MRPDNGRLRVAQSPVLTKTQTFAIPFRPSADPVNCTESNAGKWFSKSDKACYSGFATKITFDLAGQVLSDSLIWTVAYDTSGYSAHPLGDSTPCAMSTAGCGYDSLNVGVFSFVGQPSAGTDVPTDSSGSAIQKIPSERLAKERGREQGPEVAAKPTTDPADEAAQGSSRSTAG